MPPEVSLQRVTPQPVSTWQFLELVRPPQIRFTPESVCIPSDFYADAVIIAGHPAVLYYYMAAGVNVDSVCAGPLIIPDPDTRPHAHLLNNRCAYSKA